MKIWVGTSGYNYPEWRGSFYPANLPAAKMLPFYAERFPTVEINSSFYRMPNTKTIRGWAQATPEGFTFVLKAPKRITHDARLKDVDAPLRYFLETARMLGPKLGPILFQLPPYFKKDTARLRDFLALIPEATRAAFEFRHESWFCQEIYDLLGSRDSALAIVDTEQGSTPEVATADFGYLRLRGAEYSESALKEWIEVIRRTGATWREAFVFFKHEEAGTGPALAQGLHELAKE